MKNIIASTILALSLVAGLSATASASECHEGDAFSAGSFFQQMQDNGQ